MKYRPEVDGLRALAVIPVILFHAGFNWFSGGFIGVDIFFVISGYLITTILLEDIENDRFSLVGFYERRARRILPALFFVMLCCLPFAWLWMLPDQMKAFAQSIVAVGLFVSNILFWRESGYFDAAAEEKPLLHTWSLAVEEQYYLLFPVLLFGIWRFSKHRAFWIIASLAAVSFALSEWGWRNNPVANFYLTPMRMWELLAGSLAAFIAYKRGVMSKNWLSLAGLGAIAISIFAYDQTTPFPSFYGLAPVLGVVLLILYGGEKTYVAKILRTRPLVGLGLISYSAYLWHQPLFAFARIQLFDKPSAALMAALSVASILLAIFSWRFVEQPFRSQSAHAGKFSRRTIFQFSAVAASFYIVLGVIGYQLDGKLNPNFSKPPNIEWTSLGERSDAQGNVCDFSAKIDGTQWLKGCAFGDVNAEKTVFLVGDSHAHAISYNLNSLFKKRGVKGFWIAIRGCESIPYLRVDKSLRVTNCDARFEELLGYIKRANADVITLHRWSFKMYPLDEYGLEMPYRNSEGYKEPESYREYFALQNGKLYRDAHTKRQQLNRFLQKLSDAARQLFLVYPVVETGIDIYQKNARYWSKKKQVLKHITTPFSDYERRNQFVIDIFDALKANNIKKIRTGDLFCNQPFPGRCMMQFNQTPYYYDDDHLSEQGAAILGAAIDKQADW